MFSTYFVPFLTFQINVPMPSYYTLIKIAHQLTAIYIAKHVLIKWPVELARSKVNNASVGNEGARTIMESDV